MNRRAHPSGERFRTLYNDQSPNSVDPCIECMLELGAHGVSTLKDASLQGRLSIEIEGPKSKASEDCGQGQCAVAVVQ